MEFLKAVKDANLEIYNLIKHSSHQKLCQNIKLGFGGDISMFIDLEAEKIFAKHLLKFGMIYSEESGFIGEDKNIVIIDPIDGSDNFKSNVPYFATSVALKQDNKVTHAVITNLTNGDIFYKINNDLSKTNLFDKRVSNIVTNEYSSLGLFEKVYTSSLHKIMQQLNLKYRSPGALALSLALSHEVDFVLFEGQIREFDIAAGWKICEDLYRYKDDNFLLVSKDKNIFDKIFKYIKN